MLNIFPGGAKKGHAIPRDMHKVYYIPIHPQKQALEPKNLRHPVTPACGRAYHGEWVSPNGGVSSIIVQR